MLDEKLQQVYSSYPDYFKEINRLLIHRQFALQVRDIKEDFMGEDGTITFEDEFKKIVEGSSFRERMECIKNIANLRNLILIKAYHKLMLTSISI